MSAICGVYHTDNKPVDPAVGSALLDYFKQYHADRQGAWYENEIFFGSHQQYITPISESEALPYKDMFADLCITADAILDNRKELFDRLGIPHERRGSLHDSQVILEAYKKWGEGCPRYLLGDFAFAIWDGRRKQLFCAVDSTGRRTLYYYRENGIFAFSTLLGPMFTVPGIEKALNDTWIADYLAITSVRSQLDPELTLYQDIYLLPAGHSIMVKMGEVTKSQYWKVTRQTELRLPSDRDYIEAFRDVFDEAIRSRLRSGRNVGVMMSGGLDSTSIASIAAAELAIKGERLSAFCSVPMKGYQNWLPASKLADETPYIETVKQHARNVDIYYCRAEGKHPLRDTERFFNMLEQPYKFFESLYWIDDILTRAQSQGIGVMLEGSGGNVTISWGSMDSRIDTLFQKRQWKILLREAQIHSAMVQRSTAKILAIWMLERLPDSVRNTICRLRGRQAGAYADSRELSPMNPHFRIGSNVNERFTQYGFDLVHKKVRDSFAARYLMLCPAYFSHTGQIATKQSLAYDMVIRDPTVDRRVIEFCLSLPEEQFAREGESRRLIRQAMRGVLPEMVRTNRCIRGRQGVDWLQRLMPYWPEITEEIRCLGNSELIRHYLDIDKIYEGASKFHSPTSRMADNFTLRMLMRSLIFSRFFKCELNK